MGAPSGSWSGPFGYGGGFGYQEEVTGLKLLGHRLYDSSTDRFITRDPVKDGRNWYIYCDSDPVRGVDPDGLEVEYLFGTPTQIARIEKALNLIGNTKTGKPLIDKIRAPGTKYKILIIAVQHSAEGDQMIPNPSDGGQYRDENGKWHRVGYLPVIAHELGHLVGGIPGGDEDEERNTGTYERPIERELGIPVRGKYSNSYRQGKPREWDDPKIPKK